MKAIISTSYFNKGARHSVKGRRHRGKHKSCGIHLVAAGCEVGVMKEEVLWVLRATWLSLVRKIACLNCMQQHGIHSWILSCSSLMGIFSQFWVREQNWPHQPDCSLSHWSILVNTQFIRRKQESSQDTTNLVPWFTASDSSFRTRWRPIMKWSWCSNGQVQRFAYIQ